jgi:hypothetical protein
MKWWLLGLKTHLHKTMAPEFDGTVLVLYRETWIQVSAPLVPDPNIARLVSLRSTPLLIRSSVSREWDSSVRSAAFVLHGNALSCVCFTLYVLLAIARRKTAAPIIITFSKHYSLCLLVA